MPKCQMLKCQIKTQMQMLKCRQMLKCSNVLKCSNAQVSSNAQNTNAQMELFSFSFWLNARQIHWIWMLRRVNADAAYIYDAQSNHHNIFALVFFFFFIFCAFEINQTTTQWQLTGTSLRPKAKHGWAVGCLLDTRRVSTVPSARLVPKGWWKSLQVRTCTCVCVWLDLCRSN